MCCYGDKCFLCIDVEEGCRICAILLAVASVITSIGSFVLGCLSASAIIFSRCYFDAYKNTICHANFEVTVAMFILALLSAVGLAFLVVLYSGISKRQPVKLKAYFIYGVVMVVCVAVATLGQGALGNAILFILVTYSLFLVLVHQTYFKLIAGDGAVLKTQGFTQI